ncbi:MATE family efflux transporter [Photobacterium angustum]|uniref:Multidrug resistance protein NorM n=2 Tax=Photobacterium angustum TaxID=661 RepID=Q1ZQB6_PHOAS|nr:MATE family efflux transporter [Photobacterium angustum]EAS64381.1 multidrug efflux protein NorA [Photobacterium angustum S14]PQJ67126.1 MATE family efflux transporter [Photobacterium angustum]
MHNYKKETAQLIKLAVPVLIASVAQTSMGFVDTVMAGSVSATDMAAVAVAASIWLPSILFGVGLLMALVPVVAQLSGSGKKERIPFEVQHGFYLAILISIPTMLILYNAGSLIHYMNVEPVLAEKTVGYLYAVLFAVPAFLFFQTLKSFSEGLSFTIPGMVIGFLGLLANIPLNWIFVYGKFGAPELGGIGCGVATAIVYWFMFFALLAYVLINKRLKSVGVFSTFYRPQLKALSRLFKLGFPVAASLFFEVSLFAVIALLISPLGPNKVASHQIAMNFSSLVYMLPMSIGAAVSIRVGHKMGQQDIDGARIASHCGLIVGTALAICTAIMTVIFREDIAELYTHNPEVIVLAGQLLLLAAIYQCSDAVQVVAAGALRGYKDMRAIFVCTFIAYWLIGLPSGYVLGLTNWIVPAMGPQGFWIGFILGLSAAAVMLGWRIHHVHKLDAEKQLEMSYR